MNMGSGALKNWLINKMFKGWTNYRSNLHFPDKTFNQQWKEKAGTGKG
jgi:L-lactate dehydrogenase complex protein LldF